MSTQPNDIEKLKEIFLTDVDEETKADNLAQIQEWERALVEAEDYEGWREHDVTRRVAAEAKKAYIDLSMELATRRDLTEQQRMSLYARQDAMRWLLSHTEKDGAATIKAIQADIRRALMAVS
jgi:hypothetical protein